MKLVLILLAVYSCDVVSTSFSTLETDKLKEVLLQLSTVKRGLQDDEKMINTPEMITECCSLSALECFRTNMDVHFNVRKKNLRKLYLSLQNNLTIRGVNFCDSGNSTTCIACDSHPKANTKVFFNKLESFIQMAISRRV